ncbi:hypothetical protein Ana3638_14855 [Anaerocolumna sedimenticola]|uniref:MacB-like periplasmic core domain-containing protein n=1 Tax=Anaerocolumna sedimenticola TaxID=2696063 RepID=A0A6P1TN56_9FIRM|nr:ABC transporter permease [Anaerocolumna sedimenticola]QHQ61903.1 hypothetical protein Ana3638_14855 [Anaerocolumna sedimenticola]
MKNRTRVILRIGMVTFLVFLQIMNLLIKQKVNEGLYLITPKTDKNMGISLDEINQINDDNFLLTYEVNQEKQVKINQIRYNVSVKGTNYTYPSVLSLTFIKGSYFTKQAQEKEQRTVVLNEYAAFEIFGGFEITGSKIYLDNKPYTITGVIKDGDKENKNMYIPVSLMDQQPDTYMTNLDSVNGITEEYVKNMFKLAGITDKDYYFVNLDALSKMIVNESNLSLLTLLVFLLLLLLRTGIHTFIRKSKITKELLKQYYFKEIIRKKPGLIAGIIGTCFFIALIAAVLVKLSEYIFWLILNMDLFGNLLFEFSTDCFINQVQLIRKVSVYSKFSFCVYIILFIIYACSIKSFCIRRDKD